MQMEEVANQRELMLKRLRHRSRQRGFAEADEIFIAFSTSHLDNLGDELLAQYEALLAVPDWDSFGWVSGQAEPPTEFVQIIELMQKTLRA